jgi:hypothetical protein
MAYQGIEQDIKAVTVEFRKSGLPVSFCNIQAPDGLLGPSGAPSGNYVAVGGLQNLLCMDAPNSIGSVAADEARTVADIESKALHHVTFTAYYPALSPATNWGNIGWRAVIDGVTYDIKGADNDSHQTQSRLWVQLVTL